MGGRHRGVAKKTAARDVLPNQIQRRIRGAREIAGHLISICKLSGQKVLDRQDGRQGRRKGPDGIDCRGGGDV